MLTAWFALLVRFSFAKNLDDFSVIPVLLPHPLRLPNLLSCVITGVVRCCERGGGGVTGQGRSLAYLEIPQTRGNQTEDVIGPLKALTINVWLSCCKVKDLSP